MIPKLIVTDLDKTLLNMNQEISDYSKRIFNNCRKKGIKIAYATGRSETSTKEFQQRIPPDFIISNNGAVLYEGGKLLYQKHIDRETVHVLLKTFVESDFVASIAADIDTKIYYDRDEEWVRNCEAERYDFSVPIEEPVSKLSIDCRNINWLKELVSSYPLLRLYTNSGEDWCQIQHKDCSKSNGIRFIAGRLGISLSDVVAFGDDLNDVEMLRDAGVGVAVENAIQEAREAADFIAETNENDGVAKWIAANIL